MNEHAATQFFALEGEVNTANEAIALCGTALINARCVRPSFIQACIDREEQFPTGICATTPFALPHCDNGHVRNNALCYLRLKQPVAFRRMDNEDQTVEVTQVFNLAVDGGEHLEFLSSLIQALSTSEILTDLIQLPIQDVPAYLSAHIQR